MDWKRSLAQILREHNGIKRGGSVSSHATQTKRAEVLYQAFAALRDGGYRLDDVRGLRTRHVEYLTRQWLDAGLSPSTLTGRLSVLRSFAAWIGKSGLIRDKTHYFGTAADRSTIARTDKSWQAVGVDPAEKIAAVAAVDPRVALQLELQMHFGVRAQEAMMLRPHISDCGTYLQITSGTKGGRPRVVPITTAAQRELLERAKSLCASKTASTSDPTKTLAQVRGHYFYVLKSCGITKSNGLVSHGLRHAYAARQYQQLTGQAAPVAGGGSVQREEDRCARIIVAEELGHGRESVTTHYLGR